MLLNFASIDDALKHLDAIEPGRFWLSRRLNIDYGRNGFAVGVRETWYIHDDGASGGCYWGDSLMMAMADLDCRGLGKTLAVKVGAA